MARRRSYYSRRIHHKKQFTLPLAVVAGFIPPVIGVWNRRNDGNAVASYLRSSFTGIQDDGSFSFASLKSGLMPVVAGFLVHKAASMVGINRSIARAGIPFIRI